MNDLGLTENHDLRIVNGDLVMVSGSAAIAQHIKQRLLAILGEWFLDQSVGLPWFDTILGKYRSLDVVEALIRTQITETPGVEELTSFSLSVDENTERVARVNFTARLSSGSLTTLDLTI